LIPLYHCFWYWEWERGAAKVALAPICSTAWVATTVMRPHRSASPPEPALPRRPTAPLALAPPRRATIIIACKNLPNWYRLDLRRPAAPPPPWPGEGAQGVGGLRVMNWQGRQKPSAATPYPICDRGARKKGGEKPAMRVPDVKVHVSTQSACHVSRLTHVVTFWTSHKPISKFREVDVHIRS
jgi:hypothetical protein